MDLCTCDVLQFIGAIVFWMLELSHLWTVGALLSGSCILLIWLVAIDNFVALRPVKMFQIHSMYFLSHIWNCCFYNMHWFLFWRNVIKRSQSRFLTPELLLFLLMYVHKQKYLIENLSNLLIFFLLLNLSFLVCLVWEYFLTMDF